MSQSTHAVRPFLCAGFILATCLAFQSAHASTVAVGTCKSGVPQFSTIQAAVTSAPSGSTVDVCPGTYAEQVTISKKLTVAGIESGTGDAAVIVPPNGGLVQNGNDIFGNPVAAQIFVASSSGNVTIKNLTVDGTGNNIAGCGAPTLEGIYYQNTSGTITENTVRNQYQTDFTDYGGCQNGLAINVESVNSTASVTVSDNSVRSYQKNGITATGASTGAGSLGPSVKITGNYIVGFGANALNWGANAPAAENGIQVGFGAGGTVSDNIVNDNIWGPDTISQPYNAASGILIFASPGVAVTGNEVGSAQFGIVADTDSAGYCSNQSGTISCGTADNTVVEKNQVAGTQLFDAIDLCSNGNDAESNNLYGSTESGAHIDDTCTNPSLGTTSGNNNTVTANIINEACAGILTGTGTSGNTVSPNTFYNAINTTQPGDTCVPPPVAGAKTSGTSTKSQALRPAPYKPMAR